MKRFRVILAAASVMVAGSVPVRGQVVRGVVADSVTTELLEGVLVELVSPSGRTHVRAPSGAGGQFELSAPGAGIYMLRTQRQGYRRWVSPQFRLEADTTARLQLVPSAGGARAGPAVSSRDHEYLEQVGFHERRRSTGGHFLDPEALLKVVPRVRLTTEVLDAAPGITVMTGGGTWGYQIPQVTRHGGCGPGESDGKPRVYLDGKLMNSGPEWFDLVQVNPGQLLAVEIYDEQPPLQYGGTDAICGVLVIWTRR